MVQGAQQQISYTPRFLSICIRLIHIYLCTRHLLLKYGDVSVPLGANVVLYDLQMLRWALYPSARTWQVWVYPSFMPLQVELTVPDVLRARP